MSDAAPAPPPGDPAPLAVVRDERLQIMEAMAEVMAELGFAATTVDHVAERAGVDREAFDRHFPTKLACFLAAFDEASEQLFVPIAARVTVATDAVAPLGPAERLEEFDELFGAYLEGIVARPHLARVFLIEVYAAGPEAMERRTRLQAIITDATAALLGASNDRGRFACQALVAAVSALVTPLLAVDDLAGIRRLREPIVDLAARSLLT